MDLETNLIQLRPIGVVRNSIRKPTDDCWGGAISIIDLDPNQFGPQSVLGLSEFSHLEVIFLAHLVDVAGVDFGARHPRNDASLPLVGILAQRPKARPNRLCLSRCSLMSISGLSIQVKELDALDGSPILDVKPWFKQFAPRGSVFQPSWVSEITANYFGSSTS